MNNKPIIAGIGEFLWDMLPTGKQLGGAPCNFAYHAKQAGCECYVISAVGIDEPGDELLSVVRQLGLTDEHIQRNGYPTSTVTIKLNEHGHPDYTIHEQVAWDHIRMTEQITLLAGKLDAICFGSLAQRNAESRETIISLVGATNPGCLKIFDINLRQKYYDQKTIEQSLILSDVLKLNDDELPVVARYAGINGDTREILKKLLGRFNLKYIVYTMGDNGSAIVSPDGYSFIEAPKVTVADTVGAGDAFTAVFTAGVLKGIPLSQVHIKATEIAALVCTRKGATPELSTSIF